MAARGLDVDHVELVVNYELPESPELLTHRVGRTGRMGKEGAAYTLIAETDDEKWGKLKRGLKQTITLREWNPKSRTRGATATSGPASHVQPAAKLTIKSAQATSAGGRRHRR